MGPKSKMRQQKKCSKSTNETKGSFEIVMERPQDLRGDGHFMEKYEIWRFLLFPTTWRKKLLFERSSRQCIRPHTQLKSTASTEV